MEDQSLPLELNSALKTVAYPFLVHLPMMIWLPVMRIAATMCRGPLLQLLSRSSTLMLQVPLVGAMASHVQWATALTCGSHVFVTPVGQMPCGDDVLFELLTGFQ